jgi:hypothetical protein
VQNEIAIVIGRGEKTHAQAHPVFNAGRHFR